LLLALGLGWRLTLRSRDPVSLARGADLRAQSVPTATPTTTTPPEASVSAVPPGLYVERTTPPLTIVIPRWLSLKVRHATHSCSAYQQAPWLLFRPAWRKALPDDPSLLEKIVDDPDGKVEAEFRVPDYLRPRVLFWMRVHSNYTREMRLFHDRNDL